MAEPAFCTVEDIEGYEPTILDLSSNGHINNEMAAARKEIEDRLITALIIPDLDKLGATVFPRQLRTPSIFLTLELIFSANTIDDDSPYAKKADYYGSKFSAAFNSISVLDLDNDEDGTIEDGEENTLLTNHGRLKRT